MDKDWEKAGVRAKAAMSVVVGGQVAVLRKDQEANACARIADLENSISWGPLVLLSDVQNVEN